MPMEGGKPPLWIQPDDEGANCLLAARMYKRALLGSRHEEYALISANMDDRSF